MNGLTQGISQGLNNVRDGFSKMFSGSPFTNLIPSTSRNNGGGLLGGLGDLGGNGGGGLLGGLGGLGGNGGGGGSSLIHSVPLVGSCDRIAYQGIGNCMTNFRPSTVGTKGQCCAWRKYKACINGLRSGVRIAAQAQQCPKHSFSRSTINRISDQMAGFPLSQCGSNPCGRPKKKRN
ncbi:hypothetical protein RDWZM_004931 [Blomia tropicalis]|uniref:Uncharacterized protein n=1 Tax=Blomia tropicalis TaxID=40697 RepID=A0A9Q0M569_BLOTA|nr:hypothetical protein RDWZM_004931 [Blomia tropicalis]